MLKRLKIQEVDFVEHPMLAQAMETAGLKGRLFAAGNLSLLQRLPVAIAGSREADGWSLTSIEALAGELAHRDACIVSGGARGTDCAAHRGALQAGGSTIVVVPCALEDLHLGTWRKELTKLWDLQRTLFLSPFALGHRVQRSSPILRNRLIAALAWATVAGQTGLTGGTNHFIACARQLRLPLFVLATRTNEERLLQAQETLIQRGARLFSAEAALDAGLAEEIVHRAITWKSQRDREDGAQTTLCESPEEYLAGKDDGFDAERSDWP